MKIFKEIDRLNKVYKSLQPLKLEQQKALDKKIMLEFNYNTNHIEGNTFTYSETELLLFFENVTGSRDVREIDEMRSSRIAFDVVNEWATDLEQPLTEQKIKNLNEILLVKPFWKDAITPDGQKTKRLIKIGNYKEFPNSVKLQNGEIFHYASPQDTPILMGELMQWYHQEEELNVLHPAYLAALLHYKFVRIHPFDDGNGRIARLLMNYVLVRHNLPPVIIKTEDKKNYLIALNQADTGNIEAFCNYIAEQLSWSLKLAIKAAKGESLDEPGDLDKKIQLLKKKYNSKEEYIKIKRTDETIKNVFENNIDKLLTSLSKKLMEFDVFFKSKHERIEINGTAKNTNNDIVSLLEDLTKEKFTNLKYLCRFNGFRKGIRSFDVEIMLNIMFHENVYEFHFPPNTINKRYDELLSNEENNIIIENVGNYFIEKIEEGNKT